MLTRSLRGSGILASRHCSVKVYGSRGISGAAPPLAFAFDIDGVLKAGPGVLPRAQRTLSFLNSQRIPFILITNGGGVREDTRGAALSRELGVPIAQDQLVQSHTVMRSLVPRLKDTNILVVGGAQRGQACREVAEWYGFKNVFVPGDIHRWAPSISPFIAPPPPTDPADLPHAYHIKHADFSRLPFSAVLVFHDSREWGLDIQIITELLRSRGGVMGTEGPVGQQGVEVHFSNCDVLWTNEYPLPRYGQGAFIEALKAVYAAHHPNSPTFEHTLYGKPHKVTYDYASALLSSLSASRGPPKIWMVGDNPASDIAGANAYGWASALVRTGVFKDERGPPAYEPMVVVDDCWEAVREACRRELGWEVPRE